MVALLLKASLIVAILLAFYKLFLENESFFAANRIYLIGCLVLTFLLPFVSLPKLMDDQGFISTIIERTDHREFLSSSAPRGLSEGTLRVSKTQNDIPENGQARLIDWLLWLYYFGVVVFSLNLFVQIANTLIKTRNSTDKVHDIDGVIINKRSVQEPCSFFNYIFINPESYDYDTYEQILAHEKIHVKKLHAVDLLIAEIAVILLWFNPLIWVFRREVEKNMEYETDELMLKGTTVEKEKYQMNLLKIATYRKPLTITTNYNQSLIKQRICRMNAKKSSPHSYWKYAFVAPLLFAMLLVINRPISVLAGHRNESLLSKPGEQNETHYSNDCKELLQAVKEKNIEKVKQLLKTVDPDCFYMGDGEPRSPMVAAARQGDLVIGKLLIDAGADVEFHAVGDETPLMAASAHGHLDVVKHLVTNDADVNKKLRGDGSALLIASREGHLETVKYLISQGAEVNAQVDGDGTPLICAVRNDHYEISRILLENGADPYLLSPGDEYAMFHARISNNKSIIDLLKKYEKDN
jgi:beta-lactamase regulating signal transducer with metallopeptidase domain